MKLSITTQNPSIENINDCNKTADLVPCINDCTRMPNLLQPHIEPPSGQQHITTLPTTPILDLADQIPESAMIPSQADNHPYTDETGPTNPPSGQQAIPTCPEDPQNPSLYVTVLKQKLKQLERDAALGGKIRNQLRGGRKQYTGTNLGRCLYAMAAVHAPKIGMVTLAKIFSLACAANLIDLGVSEDNLPSLASITPSATTLNRLVVELGVDMVLLISDAIKDKKLSLICDKGENKGPNASFVKLLCWYNKVKNRVDTICFGIKSTGNTSKDAAQSIDHSLKLFEYSRNGAHFQFSSSTTGALEVVNKKKETRYADQC